MTTAMLQDEIPSNLYKPTDPLPCTVLESRRLTALDSPNDVQHIVLNLGDSGFKYLEGQSIGVLPPGTDAQGKPYKLRLYSIASPAVGDDGQGKTVSVCVKRALGTDPATGELHPGVCSGYLCDLPVGATVQVTGPVGKTYLMPPDPSANLIMVATGTGIAPFRAFLKKRAVQADKPGQSWVYFGAQTHKDDLYAQEFNAYQAMPGFQRITAFSREQQTADGHRMYVQHRIQETALELIPLLQQPNTYLYLCGLKGMEPGILDGLSQAAAACEVDWFALFATLKAEKRWLVEVY